MYILNIAKNLLFHIHCIYNHMIQYTNQRRSVLFICKQLINYVKIKKSEVKYNRYNRTLN